MELMDKRTIGIKWKYDLIIKPKLLKNRSSGKTKTTPCFNISMGNV